MKSIVISEKNNNFLEKFLSLSDVERGYIETQVNMLAKEKIPTVITEIAEKLKNVA